MSIFEAVCCACLTDFHSHRRLVRHVSRVHKCHEVYFHLDAHRQIPLLDQQLLDAIGEQHEQASTQTPEAFVAVRRGSLAIGPQCSERLQQRAIKIPGPLTHEADAVGIRR